MANVFRLLQLTRLISSKPCSKLDPSSGFRHFRQVGFGQAENVCLMARSSLDIGGARDSSGGHRRFVTHQRYSASEMTTGNGEIGEPEPQDSYSKHENLENEKNEFQKPLNDAHDENHFCKSVRPAKPSENLIANQNLSNSNADQNLLNSKARGRSGSMYDVPAGGRL